MLAPLHRIALSLLILSTGFSVLASPLPADELRDLNSHCPFTPPASMEQWRARAVDLKLQLQVALGLFPTTELDPVEPNIYGRVERDDYTIDKVTFESLPGFYVTGNLYRPKMIDASSKVPAILAPHGHWDSARFYEARPAEVKKLLADGSERFESAARNHIQARCVQLARMGCIVFHWDMIGYCDNTQISFDRAHRFAKQPRESEITDEGWLLFSPLAETHAQSILGLQTLAIQRAVDMLLTLPEVDPKRIGISGASGGGTQSFLGAAVDERIQLAFPAVMVSTGMQGGCTCENASWLRTGTGNVEMAALIAPRPLGLTAANDWTKTMPEDGFPQLQKIYQMFKAPQKVALFPALHFGHNFNHVSRVGLYGWVSEHFGLGIEKPVLERDFDVALRDELTVWDAEHPQPTGGEEFERKLMKLWAGILDRQMLNQLQGDATQVKQLSDTLEAGWRVCLGLTTNLSTKEPQAKVDGKQVSFQTESLPAWQVTQTASQDFTADELRIEVVQSDKDSLNYRLQLSAASSENANEQQSLQPLVPNPRLAAAYTYGYNLPLFTVRAQQLAASLRWLRTQHPTATIQIHGQGANAALAAAGVFVVQHQSESDAADQTTAGQLKLQLQPGDFAFAKVESIRHADFLPAAARFWDLPGLVASTGVSTHLVGSTSELATYRKLTPLTEVTGTQLTVD